MSVHLEPCPLRYDGEMRRVREAGQSENASDETRQQFFREEPHSPSDGDKLISKFKGDRFFSGVSEEDRAKPAMSGQNAPFPAGPVFAGIPPVPPFGLTP